MNKISNSFFVFVVLGLGSAFNAAYAGALCGDAWLKDLPKGTEIKFKKTAKPITIPFNKDSAPIGNTGCELIAHKIDGSVNRRVTPRDLIVEQGKYFETFAQIKLSGDSVVSEIRCSRQPWTIDGYRKVLKDYFEFKNADPELFTQAECEKKHAKEMKKQGRLTPDEYEKQQAKEMEKQEKEMKKKEAEEMKKHKTIDAQNTNQKSVSKIAEERGVKKVDAHAHDGAYESNESSSSDKARSNR